jgi:hypothetical protein
MKRFFRVAKYLVFGLLAIALLAFIGLLVYYQVNYQHTPPPPTMAAAPSLNKPLANPERPILLPIPKKMSWTGGHFALPQSLRFSAPAEDVEAIKKITQIQLHREGIAAAGGAIQCVRKSGLAEQAYRLTVTPAKILIEYHDQPGLFYAFTTLKQLANQSKDQLPGVQIEDQPDLKTRGVMLDISRNKVPTLKTLLGMVDFLADLKYNHLQLYVEGFSFGYPSFKKLWQETETPLLPEEIRQLDAYCKDRYIELVPNQNCLGHMAAWLETEEYKDLAECPEGYRLLGLVYMKTTLSPTNPRTLQLVKQMSEDLLPNFSSNKFNVNLDEPFELGKSKKRRIDDPKEVAKLYMDYAKKLNTYVNSKGKSMLMWGDVVSRNPEIIPEIPKNITLLEWGYESDHLFKTFCPRYQKAGLHYLVCPGTSSWSSFTSRLENMMGNVENAVGNGVKYGADGMVMTDWGDFGHLQYLPVSYAGLSYAGALSWNFASKDQVPLGDYLSREVFKDKTGIMGDVVMELGRYRQFEEYPIISMTTTGMSYMFGILDKSMNRAIFLKMQSGISDLMPMDDGMRNKMAYDYQHPKVYNYPAILDFVAKQEKRLLQTHLDRPDSTLIHDEYKNAIRMIRLGCAIKRFNYYHQQQSTSENKALLTEMKTLCANILSEHERLWMQRNKRSRIDLSSASLEKIQNQVNDQLARQDQFGVVRWVKNSMDEVIAAAGSLYLK